MINYKKLCVFDLETDGLDTTKCSPTQIAGLMIDARSLSVVENGEFYLKVKPEGVEDREKYLSDNDVEFLESSMALMIIGSSIHGKTHGFKLLGGYAHPFNGTNRVFGEGTPHEVHEKNAVDGLSWLMRWETWDKYGPLMDNARGVRQSEDWEWCQRVRQDECRVGVVWPHVVRNMGLIDTFGEEIPGVAEVRKQQGMDVRTA